MRQTWIFMVMDFAKVTNMAQILHCNSPLRNNHCWVYVSYQRIPTIIWKNEENTPVFSNYIICVSCLSKYTSTKTTYCNRLNAETDVRIQLSFIQADMQKICKNIATFLTIEN